jgi:hypothetical protein
MPSLEYIVRPYQARDPQGRVIIPSTPIGTHQQATITWGGKATLPPVQSQPGNAFSCCSEQQNESGRQTEVVQINDSGNADNYITVARTTQLSLDKTSQSTCASDWDQFSGIGMEISDALSSFAADITSSETLQGDGTPQTCKSVINLSNNTAPSG